MCNVTAGIIVTVVGAVLVVLSCTLSFTLVPNIVESIIKSEVRLENNTEQWKRFEKIPFPLTFNVRIFNISNPDEVLAGGVPVVTEVGPYVFKSSQTRIIEGVDGDKVMYRINDYLEFDTATSFPLTLEDEVTIANVAYHGILQTAEMKFPILIPALALAMDGVFGVHNNPIMTVAVGALLLDGIKICANPGFFGAIACAQIRTMAADQNNIEVQADGTLNFTFVKYKHNNPSKLYVASRGIDDVGDLGRIQSFNGSSYLNTWVDGVDEEGGKIPSVCNMINGTDSGIFPPFVNRHKSLYAFNTDVCRSAELRYQDEVVYRDSIPAARFTADSWFLDNHQGCFCINTTSGITRDNGCLYAGAMEMYSCVGAPMVMSYPHFLYADSVYTNGVIGLVPNAELHRLFVDLEPNTGTVVRGMKRAQFNVFMRRVDAISDTYDLRTTLMPILWIEEGMELPDTYVDMLNNRLLSNLRLVEILVPVAIALTCLIFIVGVTIIIVAKRNMLSHNN